MMHRNSRAPLRRLLVTDGNTIPNWLFKCVENLERSGAATCVTVLQAAPEDAPGPFRFLQGLRRFLFWLYQNVERDLLRSLPDAHAPNDLRSALPHCRDLEGTDPRNIEEKHDEVLEPFGLLPDGWLVESTRYGV